MKINDVTRPNAHFQQWEALLHNRTKRTQTGTFIIQGVLPINVALSRGLGIEAILYRDGPLSDWAQSIVDRAVGTESYRLSDALIKALGEKTEDVPELLLVAKMPTTTLLDMRVADLRSKFILVLDRPQNPGNVGAVVRSADALGVAMVIVTGHAADPYDPKSVRASRGSLFALPVIRVDSQADVLQWLDQQQMDFTTVGLSEDGDTKLWDYNFQQPTLAVIGNETWGLSKQWKESCNNLITIPMSGSASSLNAASSAAIALYEYARQCGKVTE